jgi:integrase
VYDLRHTHATLLLLAGIPIHVVAARLGDDPATVLRHYAHLLKNTQQEAAEVFERLIGGAG